MAPDSHDNMWDILLRFKSRQLEKAFWQSTPVVDSLLRVDRLATATILLNNYAIAYDAYRRAVNLRAGDGAPAQRLALNVTCCAAFVVIQMAAMWWLSRHRDSYLRHRNTLMVFHRLLRIATVAVVSLVTGVWAEFTTVAMPKTSPWRPWLYVSKALIGILRRCL